jgi:hypothetical protein
LGVHGDLLDVIVGGRRLHRYSTPKPRRHDWNRRPGDDIFVRRAAPFARGLFIPGVAGRAIRGDNRSMRWQGSGKADTLQKQFLSQP